MGVRVYLAGSDQRPLHHDCFCCIPVWFSIALPWSDVIMADLLTNPLRCWKLNRKRQSVGQQVTLHIYGTLKKPICGPKLGACASCRKNKLLTNKNLAKILVI